MAMLKDVADFFIALAQETAEMDMGDAMTNLRLIPTVEPMFREDGVPVFSYREVTN